MALQPAIYTHGHHESVLRSHSQRTAANSAGYLLNSIVPSMHILDVGCGPGTITADFAALVAQGQVVGIDNTPEVLELARSLATDRGLDNIQFVTGDINALEFPDNTFDIAHANQVLQHVSDPVQALREMRRVVKPGGLVAVREADFEGMIWYPEIGGMADWLKLYSKVARSNGGEPNAGRRLHAWARQAGFKPSNIIATASTSCYNTAEERAWWSSLWAERIIKSSFAQHAICGGHATENELLQIAKIWEQWGADEDGWFTILQGEIICHV